MSPFPPIDSASEDSIRPIADFAVLFGVPLLRERFAPDYLRRLLALRQGRMAAAQRFTNGSPFWAARRPPLYSFAETVNAILCRRYDRETGWPIEVTDLELCITQPVPQTP